MFHDLPQSNKKTSSVESGMNRFDREHVDGIGDGLSIALGVLRRARTLEQARESVTRALVVAREAKDRHNLLEIMELASVPVQPDLC